MPVCVVCGRVCVCRHEEISTWAASTTLRLLFFSRQGLSLRLTITTWLCYLATGAPRICLSLPAQRWGFRCVLLGPATIYGCWRSVSGPQADTASTSPAKQSPGRVVNTLGVAFANYNTERWLLRCSYPRAKETKQIVGFPGLGTTQYVSQPWLHLKLAGKGEIQIPRSPLGLTNPEVAEAGPVILFNKLSRSF